MRCHSANYVTRPQEMTDLRIALDVFVTLAVTEVIAKPIAIRIGKALLKWLDNHLNWIPNWLHTNDDT